MLGQLKATFRSVPQHDDEPKVESILKKSRFNFYQEYVEGVQRRKMEEMKNDSILQERLTQETERDLMESEEQLSWNAYELPLRNRMRLIKRHLDAQRQAKETRLRRLKDEVRLKEEGFTYHNGVLKEFSRWRDSPALFRYYHGHKGQVYAFKMSESLDCFLSASADTTLKLWDFNSGTCVRTFEGHGKAVRDCDLSPGFSINNSGGLGLAVSCSTDKTLRIWDARTGGLRKAIRGHTDVVYAARFSPDGRQICSASADCTVRLFDALEGHLNYIFYGHESAVVSISYAPSGRYIVSSSDYGERAVKLWDADMPATRSVKPITVRIQWTPEGLISRMTLVTDPPKALLDPPKKDQQSDHYSEKRQDPWDLLTDGEDEESEHERRQRAKEERGKQSDTEHQFRDYSIQTAPDVKESGGFTLSVASVDRFGRSAQVDQYHGGVTLKIILRGVNAIAEFFVGSYIKSSIHDTFIENSGRRSGQFSRSLPLGIRHTCNRAAIHTRRFNAESEIILSWQAPSCGSGTLIMRATVAAAVESKNEINRIALSYTLTEVEPPKKGSVLSDLSQQTTTPGGHTTVFNFTASILHQLFIELIRNRDTAEASNMVSPASRLKIRQGLKRGANTEVYRGKVFVMEQVDRWMANGVSIVKDAKDLSPGKSMGVLLHGVPLELPPSIKQAASKISARPISQDLGQAKKEVTRRQDWRHRRLQCSEEVRSMWEPSIKVTELPKPAAVSESLISDGRYGGNLPHLQMPLPFLYPINARGFGTHDAARKGIEAMDSLGKDDSGIGKMGIVQRSNLDRHAQVLALSKFGQLRSVAQRAESSRRHTARIVLSSFEKAGSDLGTAGHVRANAVLTAGFPFHPLPDRIGYRRLCQLQLVAKMGPITSRHGDVAFLMRQPVIQEGQRYNIDIRGGTLSKNEKPLLRRRNSFPALPGLAAKPRSKLLEQKDETRLKALARVAGGCLRTFWACDGDFHSHHHTVNQVVWSLDEKRIASCSNDKTVRLWAPQTGQCVRTLVGHDDAVMGCAFSEDGLRLVSCGMDNFLILWNTVNGEMLRRFFGHDDIIYRCVLFRNSSAMLSCSSDRTLKSWFLTPQPPNPPDRPAISDAGQRAAYVTWRAPPAYNDDIVAYKIQWRVGLRVAFKNETTVDGSTFIKQVDGLKPGQNYQFRICAVNRMGQGDWSEPSAQHVTQVGIPEPLEQPVVIRSWFRPRRIVFCWHAPLATVEGTAIHRFRTQCAGEGGAFGTRPDFEKYVTWKEGRALAQHVEAALLDEIREDANTWRRSGPATKGKTFEVPEYPLVKFNQEATAMVNDEKFSPEERSIRLRRIDRRRRRTIKRLTQNEQKRQEDLCFAKLNKGILMAAAFDELKPGFDYRCRVSAVSSVGEGPFSLPTYNAKTPPDHPANPRCPIVKALSQTALKLKWVAPLENGSAIMHFLIRRKDATNDVSEYTRHDSEAVFDGLKPGKKYSFQLCAFNQIGSSTWSPWSEPTSTLTALPKVPERPTVLEATIIAVTLRCVKPDNAGKIISTVVVQRRELRPGGVKSEWANKMRFPPNPGGTGVACIFTISSLKPYTVYQFRCAAINAHGQSDWSLPSFRIRTCKAQSPAAPQHPRISEVHPASVHLIWIMPDHKGSPIIGHTLELKRLRREQPKMAMTRLSQEAMFLDTHEMPRTTTTDRETDGIVSSLDIGYRNKYEAENLEPSAKYIFRVAAYNGEGQGDWSCWSDTFVGGLAIPLETAQ